MTQKWTAEPWTVQGIGNPHGTRGDLHGAPRDGYGAIGQMRDLADAKRVAACVNACAGIDDESLVNIALNRSAYDRLDALSAVAARAMRLTGRAG